MSVDAFSESHQNKFFTYSNQGIVDGDLNADDRALGKPYEKLDALLKIRDLYCTLGEYGGTEHVHYFLIWKVLRIREAKASI